MKLLLLLCLFSSSLWAQDFSEILYYQGRSLGSTPAAQLAKTKEILAALKPVLESQGVETVTKNLKDRAGNSYPVLVILPSSRSALNQEAGQVSSLLNGLPLIFSPYDLGRSGANAFFDPSGEKIGVSYRFILGDFRDSSYLHELSHAQTYARVMKGAHSLWAGVMELLKGENMSDHNRSYYTRFASVDELPATAYSLFLETNQILDYKRTLSAAEFLKGTEELNQTLREIHHSTKVGQALALQSADLAARALETRPTLETVTLKLGRSSKEVIATVFLLDSYSRTFVAGRGVTEPQAQGVRYKLYWSTKPTDAQLSQRLTALVKLGQEAYAAFQKTEKCLYVLVEFPDLGKTDYRCLEAQGALAHKILQR
jgi:hypothetical protein